MCNSPYRDCGLRIADWIRENNPPISIHRSSTIYVLEVTRALAHRAFVSRRPAFRWRRRWSWSARRSRLGLHDEVVPKYYSVKESVFPFNKFPGVDIILGPEMRSTGEVMGIDDTFPRAFAKSQMAANAALPASGTIFLSVADRHKPDLVPIARGLADMGYRLISTRGTAAHLRAAGIAVDEVPKLQEGRPNLIDYMKNGQVVLVINTPSGKGARTDEGKIRAAAVAHGVTCITTLSAAQAAVEACRGARKRADGVSLRAVSVARSKYGRRVDRGHEGRGDLWNPIRERGLETVQLGSHSQYRLQGPETVCCDMHSTTQLISRRARCRSGTGGRSHSERSPCFHAFCTARPYLPRWPPARAPG